MEMSSDTKTNLPVILRILRVIIVLVIAMAVGAMLVLSRKKPEKQIVAKTPPRVEVIKTQNVSKVMTVEAFGTVKPRNLVQIAAEVPGKIVYLHPSFIEGGRINKGDLLIRIDQRSYKLDRQAAGVQVRQARTDIDSLNQDIENLNQDVQLSQANAALAQKELDRITALHENQFASKTVLDKAEQQYLQAKISLQNVRNRLVMTRPMMEQKTAALSMARVNFEKADLAFKRTEIVSPFDGWVMKKLLEVGEYVNPGQPIGMIYEKDRLDVDVSIPIEMMTWLDPVIKSGRMPDAKISIVTSEGSAPNVWPAKVARFKAGIDEKTRTLPMTLEINTLEVNKQKPDTTEITPLVTNTPETGTKDKKELPAFDLKPGAFVKCIVKGVTYHNIFVLPRHLLRTGDLIFLINENHLKIKKVSVLRKFEEEIFINQGLNPGDLIISSPLPGAIEGMALTIKANGE